MYKFGERQWRGNEVVWRKVKKELAIAVKERKVAGKKIPHLAAILVGNDGGSISYVNAKVKACEEIGFESTLIRYDDSVSEEVLLNKVKALNEDKSIDGFIDGRKFFGRVVNGLTK